MPELKKAYNPREVEDKIYQFWEKTGFFNPDKLPGNRKKSFVIVLPPPNVTGELHMGHALNAVVQDILIRRKRMAGFKTLWLPGIDHAGIATQNVVEKELRKEGKTKFDLGREKFVERVWEWKEKYGNIILDQFKKIGSSCDWSRTRFTMDKNYVLAVEKSFSHYHKKGWIYRGERVINWCPRCQTSLSDLELEYKEEKGHLWHIKYPLKKDVALRQAQGNDNFIIVATTRPETMLGDAAVAVNPNDKRYKKIVSEKVVLPIQDREIPIITDKAVDPKFGTGAVKVTPAHDSIDWEIGLRHKLAVYRVINEKGKMTKDSKICDGLTIAECREKVVKELEKENLIEKIEDYSHSLPYCYRCHSLIEPLPSKQWFLKMDHLAKVAIRAVKSGDIRFTPKNFEKIYFDWLKNIKDWCISRQIWWGHKIPIEGENDVLDTWFSSALWPFATLGWPRTIPTCREVRGKPKKISDLDRFYPTAVLSTARDIINLWVTRMIFSGLEFTKKIPFKDIFIHPTVLTLEGKRMSKSLGTGTNPLNLIEKYGADATRFGICWQITGVQDVRFSEDHILAGQKFCNKIWNATRFITIQTENKNYSLPAKIKKTKKADEKIFKDLEKIIKDVNSNLNKYQFGQALQKIYHFFWKEFCDKYIEDAKERLQKAKTKEEKNDVVMALLYVLLSSLKLLHPFIPFVTEEIYQNLPLKNRKQCLMVEDWPN